MKRILTLLLMCSIGSYRNAVGVSAMDEWKCEKTGKIFQSITGPLGGNGAHKECVAHCKGPCKSFSSYRLPTSPYGAMTTN